MSLKRSFHSAITTMVALLGREALDYCLDEARCALVAAYQKRAGPVQYKMCLVDADGRFYDVNERLLAHLRLARDEFLSRTVFDLFPRRIAERRMSMIRKAMTEGHVVQFMDSRNGVCFETIAVPLRLDGYVRYNRALCMTRRIDSAMCDGQIFLDEKDTRHVWERVEAR